MENKQSVIYKYRDKIYHTLVNMIGIIIICIIPGYNLFHALTLMIFISFIKELYDRIKPNPTGFSLPDLLADLIGMILGSLIYYFVL